MLLRTPASHARQRFWIRKTSLAWCAGFILRLIITAYLKHVRMPWITSEKATGWLFEIRRCSCSTCCIAVSHVGGEWRVTIWVNKICVLSDDLSILVVSVLPFLMQLFVVDELFLCLEHVNKSLTFFGFLTEILLPLLDTLIIRVQDNAKLLFIFWIEELAEIAIQQIIFLCSCKDLLERCVWHVALRVENSSHESQNTWSNQRIVQMLKKSC